MALSLKVYQQRALASLAQFLEDARLTGPAAAFEKNVDVGLVTQYKPMPGLGASPYVCLRIPTGGGKTVMGAHIIQAAGDAYLEREFPLVMWMVPTTQIKTQTLEAFKNPGTPTARSWTRRSGAGSRCLTWKTSPTFALRIWAPKCAWSFRPWLHCVLKNETTVTSISITRT